METTITVNSGRYKKYVTLSSYNAETIKVEFSFDRYIINEINQMETARWHPEEKFWTVRKSQRNAFAFEYLAGQNPYAIYDAPLIEYKSTRPLYNHQLNMVRTGITRKQLIWAAEAGCGKTLSAIEVMEYSDFDEWIWVGPKSALEAVQLEFIKWESKIWPRMFTYDGLKKLVNVKNFNPPKGIIFDEASKLKTPTTQRTVAARFIADKIREKYDKDAYIIEMSGTPAPNTPPDWWSLAEVARPGFLKEGSYAKCKKRLGLIVQKESIAGGVYPELVTWYDDENKCKNCGKLKDDMIHSGLLNSVCSGFEPSINEVATLYERLKGLVVIHLKKDVLTELPEKIFRIIQCEPSQEILNAAKLILASAKNVVTANMLLRELSDGFQYKDVITDERVQCPGCLGNRQITHPVLKEWKCNACKIEGEGEFIFCPKCESPLNEEDKTYEQQDRDCFLCEGEGTILKVQRQTIQTACPKEQALIDLLDEYEDVGRIVTYAGFTGSVDRCVDICKKEGWNVIRVDGRGWESSFGTKSPTIMLKEFQKYNKKASLDKLAFIGQPEAAGMGLTLTASPVITYYSNSFKPEARIQSMDRIHRPGMDLNKGATIIDIFHLPSDKKVYDSLNAKKRLQDMSLGEFQEVFDITSTNERKL